MAKTVVINPADSTRVPFLRGILTRSLQNAGVPFEDAYRLASDVRRELSDKGEITSADLRKLIVRHLEGLPDAGAVERYQTNLRVPGSIMVRARGEAAPFSRSKLRQRLESCCISTDDASAITRIVYDRLLQDKQTEISSGRVAALTYETIQKEVGADCAHRYIVWLGFSQSGRPLLLLIGGTAASGKSTISTELASRLEIVRTQSTDMLRQVMRMMMPERLLPVLHKSSFNAWEGLSEGSRDRTDKDARVIDGYLQQAKLIEVACEAVIARAVQERASLVLEGVHVLPSLRDKIPENSDAVVVPIMLGVLKRNHLIRHIKGRGTNTPQRRSERYMGNFEDIWRLQTFILSEADRERTPIVVNDDKEATVRELMRVIGDHLAMGFDRSPQDVFKALGDQEPVGVLDEPSTRVAAPKKPRQSWAERIGIRRAR